MTCVIIDSWWLPRIRRRCTESFERIPHQILSWLLRKRSCKFVKIHDRQRIRLVSVAYSWHKLMHNVVEVVTLWSFKTESNSLAFCLFMCQLESVNLLFVLLGGILIRPSFFLGWNAGVVSSATQTVNYVTVLFCYRVLKIQLSTSLIHPQYVERKVRVAKLSANQFPKWCRWFTEVRFIAKGSNNVNQANAWKMLSQVFSELVASGHVIENTVISR